MTATPCTKNMQPTMLLHLLLLFLLLLAPTTTSTTIKKSRVQYTSPTVTHSHSKVHIDLTFDGVPYQLSFYPNKELYSSKYQETINDGELVFPEPLHHCHYHVSLGELPRHRHFHGAITVCSDAPSGLLSFSGQLVALEPVFNLPLPVQQQTSGERRRTTGNKPHTHALIKLSDMSHSLLTHFHLDIIHSASKVHRERRTPGRKLNAETKWVEMLVVNDRRRFDAKGDQTQKDSAAIVNAVNNLYDNANFDPPIRVILVAQHTFTAVTDPWESKISDPADVNVLINEFHEWRSGSVLSKVLPDHDNGHLFSSHDFNGATVGYAGVGSMCLPASSGGIDQMTFAVAANAGIVAHEMGHNFDMSHDSNGCENSHVMSASLGAVAPTTWSSCSANYIQNFFTTQTLQLACLNNKPTAQWGDPICGNGFVETGEDCDPIGADSCCDASTCKFVTGAVCSDADGSKCCQDCQFVPKALKKICRPKVDNTCDIPEYCSGDSTECPPDIYTFPGAYCEHPILKITGACYASQCKVYREQCKRVHQPAFKWSNAFSCMESKSGDERCGTLRCSASQTCSSIATMVQDGTPVGVDDGTPCAANHATTYDTTTVSQPQCKAGKCVPSTALAPTSVCGNGVTESGEQCDCGQANDPCCQCSTCKYKEGATCSNCSPCCHQCTPIKASENKVCRGQKFPCDQIETCDGTSGTCPADVFMDSPSKCVDTTNKQNPQLAGTCQVDGSCKTLGQVCAAQLGSEYGECLASEADGKVDVCGKLMCSKTNEGASGACFELTGTTPADATAGLPCTSPKPAGSTFGICNFVKDCKAPTNVVPQNPQPTLVVCSGIGTYGSTGSTLVDPVDPNSAEGGKNAWDLAVANCTNGTAKGSRECEDILARHNALQGNNEDEVVFWLVVAGVIVGCLLLLCLLWWCKEWDSPCTMCKEGAGRQREKCSECCNDLREKCAGCCRRSPEAIAAAQARKHERNKIRANKKHHKEAEKTRKKQEKLDKKVQKNLKKMIEMEELEEGQLQDGWSEVKDDQGNIFYWNDDTEESSWVKPTKKGTGTSSSATHRPTDTLIPAGWEFGMSEEYGQKFYIDPNNGESQWDRPPGNDHLQDNPMNT